MRVRIIIETPYTPHKGDSQRCIGQLRVKHPRRVIRFSAKDGVTDTTEPGPRQFVFPVGSTPVVSDDIGTQLINEGAAVLFEGEPVVELSRRDILDGMPSN